MIKILVLAAHIFSTHWNIENPDNYLDGISYSIAEADCRINPKSNYSCLMACTASIEWLSYEDTINLMPSCKTILIKE